MPKRIPLIAASLMGLTFPLLSAAPSQAMPGGGAFRPAADAAYLPVAEVSGVPAKRRHASHRRHVRVESEAEEFYFPPYAYSPAYQYGYAPYGCCELSPIYPAYGRPYFYAPPVRRRYVDYRNSHRWGFWGERGAYYLYR
jgi:hypothetical protein